MWLNPVPGSAGCRPRGAQPLVLPLLREQLVSLAKRADSLLVCFIQMLDFSII